MGAAILLSGIKKRPSYGDLVLVMYDDGDRTNDPAKKYHGQTFVVRLVHNIMSGARTMSTMYTLYGADSEAGEPYWFLESDLIKL